MSDQERPDWAWMLSGSDRAHGTFRSRREAIGDLLLYVGDDGSGATAVVGQVDFVELQHGLDGLDSARLLELMDDGLEYNDLFGALEDSPYCIPKAKADEADKALWEALIGWAEKWVEVSGAWVLTEDDPQPIEHWRAELAKESAS